MEFQIKKILLFYVYVDKYNTIRVDTMNAETKWAISA